MYNTKCYTWCWLVEWTSQTGAELMEIRTLRDGNIVLALACNEYRLIAEKLPYLKSLGSLIDVGAPDYNSYIAECAAGWYTCTEHEHTRASYYLGEIAHEQRALAARRAAAQMLEVNA